jgi:hypothetical protein
MAAVSFHILSDASSTDHSVGCAAFMAVTGNHVLFWVATPHDSERLQFLGETYHVHLQS